VTDQAILAGFHLPRLRNAALTLPPRLNVCKEAGAIIRIAVVTIDLGDGALFACEECREQYLGLRRS